MAQKLKVLDFVDRMLRGGIQSLVIDWVSRFDKTKIQVDFLLLDDGKDYELEQTLKNIGCNVYKLKGIWIRKPVDFIKYIKAVGDIFKILLKKYATDYFACSEIAGKWLFGKNIVKSSKFKIIHNAVDYEKFKYNEEERNKIRDDLKIANNDIVIGHVGRFTNQKNHEFLIDVFYEMHKINKHYKLLLIGTGILEENIKAKVEKLKLSEYVIFLGFKNDVYRYMNAMDIFAFPSLYEGLGLGLVEAQANGIPCFATKDTIPSEVKINNNFEFIELDIEKWKEKILKTNVVRIDSKKNIKEANYFIEDVVNQLMEFYLNC